MDEYQSFKHAGTFRGKAYLAAIRDMKSGGRNTSNVRIHSLTFSSAFLEIILFQALGVDRLFPEEHRAPAQEMYTYLFQSPTISPSVAGPVRRADGSERFVETRYTFLPDHDQRLAMLSIVRDITERKKVEYEWIQQQYQKVYIPATVEAPSEFKRLKSSIPLAHQETPRHICGIARRVGWKHEVGSDEAIYRLKLKVGVLGLNKATIPGFFVLKGGAFVKFVSSNVSPVSSDECRESPVSSEAGL